jgi:hypothetical protein
MRTALVGLILAVALLAADVSGTWNFEVQTEAGSGSPVMVLKQTGEKLAGVYTGALGEAQVSGTIKGDDVTIEFEVQGAKILYTGKLDSSGRSMKGKVNLADMASGTFTATKK